LYILTEKYPPISVEKYPVLRAKIHLKFDKYLFFFQPVLWGFLKSPKELVETIFFL